MAGTRSSCCSGILTATSTCGPTPPTSSDHPSRVRLSWRRRDGRLRLHAAGWTAGELDRLRGEGPEALLAVLPSQLVEAFSRLAGLACVAGRYEMAGEEVSFEPAHPFRAGLRYSLLWTGSSVELGSLAVPAVDSHAVTSVSEIHPTCPEIPHNNLKLYVTFTGPMGEGWAGRAVRVLDEASGEALEGAFLPMEPELWDPARRRLTVLFDPGRIKRGLRPHEELDYPLQPGREVVVVVDQGFLDAAGRRLVAPASRRYRVGPAERRRVDPGVWGWTWPVGPEAPLRVDFDRPLDHALLQRCIRVADAGGAELPTWVETARGERALGLRPTAPWQRGRRYRVSIDSRLEDLAGNSLRRVFDRDLARPEDAPAGPDEHTIDFVCEWR